MKTKMLLLRVCYWWGILADAVMACLMLSPNLFASFTSLNLRPDADVSYALRFGAPLMAGWTVLLFWADRRPVERKDVLLITAYPVVTGYLILNVYAIMTGLTTLVQSLPVLFSQVGLLGLSTYSYLSAKTGG